MKKITLLSSVKTTDKRRYFAEKLAESLRKQDMEASIVAVLEPLIPSRVAALGKTDCTASFDNMELLFAKKDGVISNPPVPHVSFLQEPALYHIEEAKIPSAILTTIDRGDFEGVKAVTSRAFFFPHAIGQELLSQQPEEKIYDIVFFDPFYQYDAWRQSWEEHLPIPLHPIIEQAAALFFKNNNVSIAEAISLSWQRAKLDSQKYRGYFLILFHYLDKYVYSRSCRELISSITTHQVHVFGEETYGELTAPKEKFSQKNVIQHPAVKFSQKLDILRKSKLCLCCYPAFRNGSHPSALFALASGCLPITNESKYMGDHFQEGEAMLYYHMQEFERTYPMIDVHLGDDKKRQEMVEKGRFILAQDFVWDLRAQQLIERLKFFF